MGKGDKKTKRGKIVLGSHGVRRPKIKKNAYIKVEKPIIKEVKPKEETKAQDVAATEVTSKKITPNKSKTDLKTETVKKNIKATSLKKKTTPQKVDKEPEAKKDKTVDKK